MTELDQFVDQPRHHAFGAAVKLGRNAFGQGRDLGNTHRAATVAGTRPADRANPPTTGS